MIERRTKRLARSAAGSARAGLSNSNPVGMGRVRNGGKHVPTRGEGPASGFQAGNAAAKPGLLGGRNLSGCQAQRLMTLLRADGCLQSSSRPLLTPGLRFLQAAGSGHSGWRRAGDQRLRKVLNGDETMVETLQDQFAPLPRSICPGSRPLLLFSLPVEDSPTNFLTRMSFNGDLIEGVGVRLSRNFCRFFRHHIGRHW